MRKQELNFALTIKLSAAQRTAIERLAERQETTLGAAGRFLIDRGLVAVGLKA